VLETQGLAKIDLAQRRTASRFSYRIVEVHAVDITGANLLVNFVHAQPSRRILWNGVTVLQFFLREIAGGSRERQNLDLVVNIVTMRRRDRRDP
jgi:hypothetical protein